MAQQHVSRPVEDGRVVVDGVDVHYRTAGSEGPAVVLLHGGGVDSAALSWEYTIPALAETYHVFAPNWPGFGESETPVAPYSTAYYADVLESFLDALNIEQATIVGRGLGGDVAIEFVHRRPERVDRLVLVDSAGLDGEATGGTPTRLLRRVPGAVRAATALLARSPRLSRAALRWLAGSAEPVDPTFVESVRFEAGRPGAGRAYARYLGAERRARGRGTETDDGLATIAVPTLLIHGERDPIVPVSAAIRARSLIPDAELRLIDAGHWPSREWPGEFNRTLVEYLSNTPIEDGQTNEGQ